MKGLTRGWTVIKRHPSIVALVLVFGFWEALAHWQLIGRTLLASPGEVWGILIRSVSSSSWHDRQNVFVNAFYTIRRTLSGWCIAVCIGVGLGLVTGSIRTLFAATEPVMEFGRVIPPVLALPLFLVAFNYNEPAYTWTIVFGCVPVMTLAVSHGIRSVSREKLDLLSVYRVRALVRGFALAMEVLPSVFLGARLTLTTALIIAVVTEMVFTPRNGWATGALARDSEISFNTPLFYGCVMLIGFFGYLANVGLRKLEERLGVSPAPQDSGKL